MRRFILTYTRGEYTEDIEGVQFSDGDVALECYPDNDWPGVRTFGSLKSMEYTINEFGDTSIKWIDQEQAEQ